eukprot:4523061-Pleurochrysis_carterae.AAC.1
MAFCWLPTFVDDIWLWICVGCSCVISAVPAFAFGYTKYVTKWLQYLPAILGRLVGATACF